MNKITVYFNSEMHCLGGKKEYNGTVDVLSCGVLLITQEVVSNPNSLIASLQKQVLVGIPLTSIKFYEVEPN